MEQTESRGTLSRRYNWLHTVERSTDSLGNDDTYNIMVCRLFDDATRLCRHDPHTPGDMPDSGRKRLITQHVWHKRTRSFDMIFSEFRHFALKQVELSEEFFETVITATLAFLKEYFLRARTKCQSTS